MEGRIRTKAKIIKMKKSIPNEIIKDLAKVISWLAHMGYPKQAMSQFNDMIDTFEFKSIENYENFHFLLARSFLHTGDTDNTKKVLDLIPTDFHNSVFLALNDYWYACDKAEHWNVSVRPLTIPHKNWWKTHLDFPNKDKITKLCPAKIEHIDDRGIFIVAANSENEYGRIELSIGEFNKKADKEAKDLTPNTFIEMAFYGEDLKIKVYNVTDKEIQNWEESLPPLLWQLDDKETVHSMIFDKIIEKEWEKSCPLSIVEIDPTFKPIVDFMPEDEKQEWLKYVEDIEKHKDQIQS